MPKYESFLWSLGILFPFVNFKTSFHESPAGAPTIVHES